MAKFDSIRMADLTEVQDPDKDGGITLVFKDNKFLHIKIYLTLIRLSVSVPFLVSLLDKD